MKTYLDRKYKKKKLLDLTTSYFRGVKGDYEGALFLLKRAYIIYCRKGTVGFLIVRKIVSDDEIFFVDSCSKRIGHF